MSTDRLVNTGDPSEAEGNADVRERILVAARAAFVRRGYAATSLQVIATAAGVTKPMIYYYFGNKEGLYRSLIESVLIPFHADILRLSTLKGATRDKLTRMAELYLSFVQEHAEAMHLLLSATLAQPDRGAPPLDIGALHAAGREFLAGLLDEAEAQGEVRAVNREVFAAALRGSLAAWAFHHTLHARESTHPHAARDIIDILWRGIAMNPQEDTNRD